MKLVLRTVARVVALEDNIGAGTISAAFATAIAAVSVVSLMG
jgi:hypothetical protein